MVLESTQPVTEMNTRNTSCSDCLEVWKLQPPGNLWSCYWPAQGLHAISLADLSTYSLNVR